MEIIPYDRALTVEYAHRWAFDRNPDYINLDSFGGDCTNFASQALLAGAGVMNFDPAVGWYYMGPNARAPAWAGVVPLYRFLLGNQGPGPFAREVSAEQILPGDLVQLQFKKGDRYRHTPVVVAAGAPGDLNALLVAAHTINADNRPLSSYVFARCRFLHIEGARRQPGNAVENNAAQ